MTIKQFQNLIENIYGERDRERGLEGTFGRFVEEVGELARSFRKRDPTNRKEEFADVCAWLLTLASILGVDMEEAVKRYEKGCPRCGEKKCRCPES